MANLKQETVLDLDGHVVRDARKPKKAAALDRDAEIARLNEKIEFLARTNMLYSDWEHRDAQVTSDLIRKGIEEAKINVQLRAEIESLKAQLAQPESEIKSWGETHPRNPSAACSCEHWQSCVECRPTAHAQPAQEPYGYDWSMLEAAQESLREHMARIKELEAALKQALESLEHISKVKCDHSKGLCTCEYREAADAIKAALAQPAQEPEMLTIAYQSGYHDGKQAALAKREWNFCERCGKRTADKTTIHTCTPPQEGK